MQKKEVIDWLRSKKGEYCLIGDQKIYPETLIEMIESGIAHHSFIEQFYIEKSK